MFSQKSVLKISSEFIVIRIKFRSSHSEVFLGKGVLKICSKFTGEHPCQSATSIKLLCNFGMGAKSHFGMGVLIVSRFKDNKVGVWNVTIIY